MATKHVVDTHALVWFLEGNPRLGANAKAIMVDPASELILPLIALAEACWVVEHGKSSIPSVTDLLAAVDAEPRIVIDSVTRATLDKSLALGSIPEMHDRLIVAAALLLEEQGNTVHLLTKDASIHAAGLVAVVW